jgi:hypothetical protein
MFTVPTTSAPTANVALLPANANGPHGGPRN